MSWKIQISASLYKIMMLFKKEKKQIQEFVTNLLETFCCNSERWTHIIEENNKNKNQLNEWNKSLKIELPPIILYSLQYTSAPCDTQSMRTHTNALFSIQLFNFHVINGIRFTITRTLAGTKQTCRHCTMAKQSISIKKSITFDLNFLLLCILCV